MSICNCFWRWSFLKLRLSSNLPCSQGQPRTQDRPVLSSQGLGSEVCAPFLAADGMFNLSVSWHILSLSEPWQVNYGGWALALALLTLELLPLTEAVREISSWSGMELRGQVRESTRWHGTPEQMWCSRAETAALRGQKQEEKFKVTVSYITGSRGLHDTLSFLKNPSIFKINFPYLYYWY